MCVFPVNKRGYTRRSNSSLKVEPTSGRAVGRRRIRLFFLFSDDCDHTHSHRHPWTRSILFFVCPDSVWLTDHKTDRSGNFFYYSKRSHHTQRIPCQVICNQILWLNFPKAFSCLSSRKKTEFKHFRSKEPTLVPSLLFLCPRTLFDFLLLPPPLLLYLWILHKQILHAALPSQQCV